MKAFTRWALSLAGSVALAASLATPASAQAPEAQPLPSYARPTGSVLAGETIKGTIVAVNGKYNLSVRDERGYIDNVTLRDGTIINPRGLTLAPGQSVTIAGTNAGSTFVADQIDTPYHSYGSAWDAYPYGPYPYVVYPYPVYPVYGVGFAFGGPRFGFGFHGRW